MCWFNWDSPGCCPKNEGGRLERLFLIRYLCNVCLGNKITEVVLGHGVHENNKDGSSGVEMLKNNGTDYLTSSPMKCY